MAQTLDVDLDRLKRFNRTDQEYPDNVTLQELFEARVRQDPLQPAVLCDHDEHWGTVVLSYAQLNEKANQLARWLQANRVRSGQIVGILVERSFAMIAGILGILKAGAAYLPLSPTDPLERLRYVLSDANVNLVLAQHDTLSRVPPMARAVDIEAMDLYAGPSDNPRLANGPRDLAYIIYTSGSTGKPKGVMIEHRSVVNRLHWMQRMYPIGIHDVILQKTPYCFDVSVWELFWWALEGATLCLLMPRGEKVPQAILETVRKRRITTMHFVPSMLNVFLEYLEDKPAKVSSDLSSLRRVFASGESLSPGHVHKFNRIIGQPTGACLTNLYGPTETTVDVTYFNCPADGDIQRIPIGKPIQNTKIYILKNGSLAPLGEAGELCVAGVGLARGYLNNPELTSERFVENPVVPGERIYRTGDLARWLPDGNIEYLGREDHQVKIRGLRIELGEIENILQGYPGITDCVVTTRKYSESIVLIVAYLVCKETPNVQALRQYLGKYLPDYMVPDHFERIDQLPLTANGKADRNALPEPKLRARTS